MERPILLGYFFEKYSLAVANNFNLYIPNYTTFHSVIFIINVFWTQTYFVLLLLFQLAEVR